MITHKNHDFQRTEEKHKNPKTQGRNHKNERRNAAFLGMACSLSTSVGKDKEF